VTALIIQNAVAHEEGLGRLQAVRKGFWADRAANEDKYRAGLASIEVARLRTSTVRRIPSATTPISGRTKLLSWPGRARPISNRICSTTSATISRPSRVAELVARAPAAHPDRLGRYDPVFDIAEVAALKKDLPKAEVHLLDAGHFALDESASHVARLMRGFLGGCRVPVPKATSTHS